MNQNLYGQLMDIQSDKALCAIVEGCLKRFSHNHVMTAHLRFDIVSSNADTIERKDLYFVIYRPANYTLVGTVKSLPLVPGAGVDIKSYHDSAWRIDGIGKTISDTCTELFDRYSARQRIRGDTSFGLYGISIIRGFIEHKSDFEGIYQVRQK
jgi:hypothetical protein